MIDVMLSNIHFELTQYLEPEQRRFLSGTTHSFTSTTSYLFKVNHLHNILWDQLLTYMNANADYPHPVTHMIAPCNDWDVEKSFPHRTNIKPYFPV